MIGCHIGKETAKPLEISISFLPIWSISACSRATDEDTRSLCTIVCKWNYLGHAHMSQYNEKDSRNMEACGWDDDFWEEIGLRDLVDGHHAKIGLNESLGNISWF